jgi:hypothetical protein
MRLMSHLMSHLMPRLTSQLRSVLVALAVTPCVALAQVIAPGPYMRVDGNVTHRLELRPDGTASAVTTAADGTTLVNTRFEWRVEDNRLVQSRVLLRDGAGEYRATRGDTALELRNVSADGFETRARADLPWFSWKRQTSEPAQGQRQGAKK